jgi:hypothetical protein
LTPGYLMSRGRYRQLFPTYTLVMCDGRNVASVCSCDHLRFFPASLLLLWVAREAKVVYGDGTSTIHIDVSFYIMVVYCLAVVSFGGDSRVWWFGMVRGGSVDREERER